MARFNIVDDAVATAINDDRIVGSVVMVCRDGKLVHHSAYGLADRELGRSMKPDTIFRLSSLTKPIIAATILALHDASLLRIDDPVTDYLPHFRPQLGDGRAPRITLKHLLTHTAGLPGTMAVTETEKADPRYIATQFDLGRLSLEENVHRLLQFPLLFAPGTDWAYSAATDVLGLIAAKVGSADGQLGEAVARWVSGPLGMADTSFVVTDRARLAAAYADGENGAVLMGHPHQVPNAHGGMTTYYPERIFDPQVYQSGGGGMAGTAPDFMKLLEAVRSGGEPIMSSETAEAALANQTGEVVAQKPGWRFSYMGAWLDDPAAAGISGARGVNRWGGIYGHSWLIDPEQRLSMVAMTNTGLEGSDGRFRDDIREAVYASL